MRRLWPLAVALTMVSATGTHRARVPEQVGRPKRGTEDEEAKGVQQYVPEVWAEFPRPIRPAGLQPTGPSVATGRTPGEDGDTPGSGHVTGAPGQRLQMQNPLFPVTEGSYGAYAVLLLALLVFAVGIVGNLAVMCVVWHSYHLKSAWNAILAGLALWDFLVLFFCLPIVVFDELTKQRLLGDVSCRAVPFLEVSVPRGHSRAEAAGGGRCGPDPRPGARSCSFLLQVEPAGNGLRGALGAKRALGCGALALAPPGLPHGSCSRGPSFPHTLRCPLPPSFRLGRSALGVPFSSSYPRPLPLLHPFTPPPEAGSEGRPPQSRRLHRSTRVPTPRECKHQREGPVFTVTAFTATSPPPPAASSVLSEREGWPRAAPGRGSGADTQDIAGPGTSTLPLPHLPPGRGPFLLLRATVLRVPCPPPGPPTLRQARGCRWTQA